MSRSFGSLLDLPLRVKKQPHIKVSSNQLPAIAAVTFGEDLFTLAKNINEDWVMAYLEGTDVCQQTILLSGEPAQITPLSTLEKEAIGMYTSFAIFAEVNEYKKAAKTDDRYMNEYIRILTGALMKIKKERQYPSQINGNADPVRTLYRGFSTSTTDWTKKNVRYPIEHFWSTSESRDVALSFLLTSESRDVNPGTHHTLLEITSGLEFARPIAEFSCRPDELEFLFPFGERLSFVPTGRTSETHHGKEVNVVKGKIVKE